jgi:predicted transcriptional regulator
MHRELRIELGMSQSRLARLSGVSRFKICTVELGDGSFTAEQHRRINEALQAEAERLRKISSRIESSKQLNSAGMGASGV